ncbi:MAG: hypothetical protein WEA58_12120 [Balneolaceae bacterium]
MNLILFFITINLILISRLGLTFKDQGADAGSIFKMSAIPLLSLLFIEMNFTWFILLTYLVLYPVILIYLEKNPENIYRNRLLSLVIHGFIIGLVFSPLFGAELNRLFVDIVIGPERIINKILSSQVLLFGLLLVMNEMNIVLRFVLKKLNLTSIGEVDQTVSDQEYNTGRIIGMLERIFIFIFTIAGQFAAVGFILTAKGVVRYQDFKDRTFAEYVLIGTLLSTLLAFGVALILSGLIG